MVIISFVLFSCSVIQDEKINFSESNEKLRGNLEGEEDLEIVKEYYFEPNVSIIEGILITSLHYGPPGYGEDPDNDKKEYPFILGVSILI